MLLKDQRQLEIEHFRGLPLSSKGASLLTLRDAARRLGVQAELRRFRHHELDFLPLPAVVHLKGNDDSHSHHFSVVFKLDSSYVQLIDGTTGDLRTIARSHFRNSWTGMALIDGADTTNSYGNTILCLAAVIEVSALTIGLCRYVLGKNLTRGEL